MSEVNQTVGGSYDLAFSIGGACSCTQMLRKANLQFQSFPFDWVRGMAIDARAEMIAGGMKDFLVEGDLEYVSRNANGFKEIYRSSKTGLTFYHDFQMGRTLAEGFPEVAEKYRRRQARFLARLAAARRVLVVYLTSPEDPCPTREESVRTQEILRRAFPNAEFDVLVMANGRESGVRTERWADHVVRQTFSYADTSPKTPEWSVRFDALVPQLTAVRVADYRTEEERRRHGTRMAMNDDNRRKAEYAFLRCTGRIDFFWARLNWRLYRHFRKALIRRGVSL